MNQYLPRPYLAFSVIVLVVLGIIFLQGSKATPEGSAAAGENEIDADRVARETDSASCDFPAKKVVNPSGYVNTGGEAVDIAEYIGEQVVLVDFLTYSCINCQHTFPYVAAWNEKYSDFGLQVIGIHTPEFDFEKKKENVQQAAEKFGITWPFILDNDYGTWRSYGNRYWPRKYLIDINGCVVYDHIGEGAYEETERKIQELLRKRNRVLGTDTPVPDGIVDP